MVKARRMRWAGHITYMRRKRTYVTFHSENLEGRDFSIDRSIIVVWILNRYIMRGGHHIHLAQDRTSDRLL
jgi:hypothetical protein